LDGLAWLGFGSGLVLTDDIAMTLILDVSLLFPSSVTIIFLRRSDREGKAKAGLERA
jgi:hypothetical protein